MFPEPELATPALKLIIGSANGVSAEATAAAPAWYADIADTSAAHMCS